MGEFIINSRRGEQVVASLPIGRINDIDNRVKTLEQSGGNAHIIQDECISLTARAKLNFIGTGVTATDNAGTGATDVTITSGGGSGDVVGPASATDEAIARYDLATGKLIQNSTVTLSDDGVIGNTNAVQFDTIPTALTPAEGLLQWNATDGTLDLGMQGGDITMQIGQELFLKVRNPPAGSTIPNGSVVYMSGRTGVYPDIALARSDSETTAQIVGIVTHDIASPAFGYVTTMGYVRGVKTDYTGAGIWGTTWVEGDHLFLSKTVAGQLTNVEPSAPHHSDVVGTVGVVHSAQGSILVDITKHYALQELTDVNGTALATSGQIPVWDNTAGYFDFTANINDYVLENAGITGATKTKITYDAKGLVTSGADATTSDIADSLNKRYVTDAQLTVIGNTSGTNTGNQTSIVGITGTKAQFDTAVTDGNIMYIGDAPTAHTHAISDVTGLQTALDNKLDDTQFVGLLKITVGTSAPGSPTTGDLWVDSN